MITILVDHNIEGQALLLAGTLDAEGWLDLLPLRFVRFTDVGLSYSSSDRDVWRIVQSQQMYLLTDNRNRDGIDSLEQTIHDENQPHSLPVITIGRSTRVAERIYREACAARLLEIVLYPDSSRGVGRLFIP